MKQYIALLAVAGAVAACSSTPTTDQNVSQAQQTPPRVSNETKPATPPTTSAASSSSTAGATVPATNPMMAKRSVYFDYDSSAVKNEYRPVISAHAQNLSQNRTRHMTIQGNTDERGSREYNLALGQRRADAVKQGLTLLGAPGTQIETISFGEEKPQSEGGSEAAFTQNRRADIIYR